MVAKPLCSALGRNGLNNGHPGTATETVRNGQEGTVAGSRSLLILDSNAKDRIYARLQAFTIESRWSRMNAKQFVVGLSRLG